MFLETLNHRIFAAMIMAGAFAPKHQRNGVPPTPSCCLPRGEIVVSTANQNVGTNLIKMPDETPVHQDVVAENAASPVWEHVIGKLNFIAVNTPLAQAGIGFRKKNNTWLNVRAFCQRVEHGHAIRSNDFGDDR